MALHTCAAVGEGAVGITDTPVDATCKIALGDAHVGAVSIATEHSADAARPHTHRRRQSHSARSKGEREWKESMHRINVEHHVSLLLNHAFAFECSLEHCDVEFVHQKHGLASTARRFAVHSAHERR